MADIVKIPTDDFAFIQAERGMMEELTQCHQYTLNYFGMLNLPKDKRVTVYMDKELESSISIM